MAWACEEEGCGVYREKNAEDGAAGQEEKREVKPEVHGRGEGRHARGRCDRCRRREQSEMETDDPLRQTLKGAAEIRRRRTEKPP